ncbi:MAG TPA: diguanylate cyclase [Polyangiaceae bacterium]|jgi:diguanylate cyclase (GGDEF)-like protein|nr:diguanylate cyclase [Polyangiaceae bacterium]
MSERSVDSRLGVLRATQLLDSAPEAAFDRLTRLAARLLGAPVALVSLVDDRRQFFKSMFGLAEPWASRRETPLTHSFCQYATRDRTPLVVEDARRHPVLQDNRATHELNVVAYAGMPLVVQDEAIGAFCVIDDKPRAWSADELQLLRDLADSVVSEIELRFALKKLGDERGLTEALFESLGDSVLAIDSSRTFLRANAAARELFPCAELGKPLPPDWTTTHRSTRPDGTSLPPEEGALGRGLRGETTDGLTFAMQRAGGLEPIWVEASGRPVFDARGRVIAAISVYRDVTEKKRAADLYSTLATNIPRATVTLFDRSLRCLAVEGANAKAHGTSPKERIGKSLRELAGFADGDRSFDRIEDAYRRTVDGQSLSLDFSVGGRTLALQTAPVRDAAGRPSAGIVLAVDVTLQRQTESALRRNEQIYRAIVQNLPNGAVFLIDRDLRYVAADGPAVPDILYRRNVGRLVGRSVQELVPANSLEPMLALFRSTFAGESHHLEIQREDRFYDLNVTPIYDGPDPSHVLVFLYDITTRKAELAELRRTREALEISARELREASVTDELTGLLNRRGFMLLAEQQMRIAARNGKTLVLVFVDLNGMKRINDALGHKMGDRALVDTASILRRVFRRSDVIARLGGDEFVVLATDCVDAADPSYTTRLRDALVERNASPESPFRLSLSAGTSIFDPSQPTSLEALISDADARMYEAKHSRPMSTFPRVNLA